MKYCIDLANEPFERNWRSLIWRLQALLLQHYCCRPPDMVINGQISQIKSKLPPPLCGNYYGVNYFKNGALGGVRLLWVWLPLSMNVCKLPEHYHHTHSDES